jgi:hypothetical protein
MNTYHYKQDVINSLLEGKHISLWSARRMGVTSLIFEYINKEIDLHSNKTYNFSIITKNIDYNHSLIKKIIGNNNHIKHKDRNSILINHRHIINFLSENNYKNKLRGTVPHLNVVNELFIDNIDYMNDILNFEEISWLIGKHLKFVSSTIYPIVIKSFENVIWPFKLNSEISDKEEEYRNLMGEEKFKSEFLSDIPCF